MLVLTTLPDPESARTLARALVEARLAACVTIGAPVESMYHWQGAIETAQEVPVTVKTRGDLFDAVAAASALVGLTLLLWYIGALAADLKLLPPDEAFRFAARALDTRTLEANFSIANGYYLYRDKMSFTLEPDGLALGPTTLPPGKVKDDEFFGRVETYRDRVVVRLPMVKAAPGQSVTLRADSQGCADAGVCYPPHTQRLTLAVPATDGKPGPLVEALPAKKTWFR